jgi:hypothetical protein
MEPQPKVHRRDYQANNSSRIGALRYKVMSLFPLNYKLTIFLTN